MAPLAQALLVLLALSSLTASAQQQTFKGSATTYTCEPARVWDTCAASSASLSPPSLPSGCWDAARGDRFGAPQA